MLGIEPRQKRIDGGIRGVLRFVKLRDIRTWRRWDSERDECSVHIEKEQRAAYRIGHCRTIATAHRGPPTSATARAAPGEVVAERQELVRMTSRWVARVIAT
ncbi:hypothetical protein GCM10023317_57560 [Actinopolymorpha pittospori]